MYRTLRYRILNLLLLELLGELGVVSADNTSASQTQGGKYGQIMRLKAVHLMALFILVYVGTEVTIGGWIVTFLIDERGGGASAGYVSSGFFAGWSVSCGARLKLIHIPMRPNSWANRLNMG